MLIRGTKVRSLVDRIQNRGKPGAANHQADQGGESGLDFKSPILDASQTQPTTSAGVASSPNLDFSEKPKPDFPARVDVNSFDDATLEVFCPTRQADFGFFDLTWCLAKRLLAVVAPVFLNHAEQSAGRRPIGIGGIVPCDQGDDLVSQAGGSALHG